MKTSFYWRQVGSPMVQASIYNYMQGLDNKKIVVEKSETYDRNPENIKSAQLAIIKDIIWK